MRAERDGRIGLHFTHGENTDSFRFAIHPLNLVFPIHSMRIIVAAYALLALAACGDPPTGDDDQRMSITIVGGDAQQDTVLRELEQPLEVEVRDADGRPLEGIIVKFQVREPQECGSFALGTRVVTSQAGRASVGWKLGRKVRDCAMDAHALHPRHGAIVASTLFTATAIPDTLPSLVNYSVQGAFPYAVAFTLRDIHGNDIPSFRLEAPAGAPIQALGTTEDTDAGRTLVRVDSAAWARTRPFEYSGAEGAEPYPNPHVQLRIYIDGVLNRRIVCAAQGRPEGLPDQVDPGRVDVRMAWNDPPAGTGPCERAGW